MLNISQIPAIQSPNNHGIKSCDTVYYCFGNFDKKSELAKAIARTLNYISTFCNLKIGNRTWVLFSRLIVSVPRGSTMAEAGYKLWIIRWPYILCLYSVFFMFSLHSQNSNATLPLPRDFRPRQASIEELVSNCNVIVRGQVLELGKYMRNRFGYERDYEALRDRINSNATIVQAEPYPKWYITLEVNKIEYPFDVNIKSNDKFRINIPESVQRLTLLPINNLLLRALEVGNEYIFFLSSQLRLYDSQTIPIFQKTVPEELEYSNNKNYLTNVVSRCLTVYKNGPINDIIIPTDNEGLMEQLRISLLSRRKFEIK